MTITLNNRTENFNADSLTISEIMKIKNYTFKFLVVKINSKLIKKELYSQTNVSHEDKVDIIHLISGG